jgi:hypothetical protein
MTMILMPRGIDDPAEDLPALIEPGTIEITFWKSDFDGPPVEYVFIFTWGGGREADWYYDNGRCFLKRNLRRSLLAVP